MTPTNTEPRPDTDREDAYDPAKEDQGANEERIKKGIIPVPPVEEPPIPIDDPPMPGRPPIDEGPKGPEKIV